MFMSASAVHAGALLANKPLVRGNLSILDLRPGTVELDLLLDGTECLADPQSLRLWLVGTAAADHKRKLAVGPVHTVCSGESLPPPGPTVDPRLHGCREHHRHYGGHHRRAD
jgi:hypothetical protein